MKNNLIIKILSSMIFILVSLYFIPFLGICLMILRCFLVERKKRNVDFIIIIFLGFLLLVPNLLSIFNIKYIDNFVNSDLYKMDIINYSKLLIVVGILFFILFYVIDIIIDKLKSKATSFISETSRKREEMNYQIAKENDMKVKQARETALNSSYVKCPKCGSDNLVVGKHSKCKYCRSLLENKNYK